MLKLCKFFTFLRNIFENVKFLFPRICFFSLTTFLNRASLFYIYRFEIRDDRINTYLSAFKENFNSGSTQLVMFVLPNNKKERYDALKKCTCVDYAGKYLYFKDFNKVKITQFDDIYFNVCLHITFE